MMKSENLRSEISEAVAYFWRTRFRQAERQKDTGRADQGARSAVTGGAQMNGFVQLITNLILETGIDQEYIFY